MVIGTEDLVFTGEIVLSSSHLQQVLQAQDGT